MLPDKYKLLTNPICQSAVESRWLLKAEHLKLEELTTSARAHITNTGILTKQKELPQLNRRKTNTKMVINWAQFNWK